MIKDTQLKLPTIHKLNVLHNKIGIYQVKIKAYICEEKLNIYEYIEVIILTGNSVHGKNESQTNCN